MQILQRGWVRSASTAVSVFGVCKNALYRLGYTTSTMRNYLCGVKMELHTNGECLLFDSGSQARKEGTGATSTTATPELSKGGKLSLKVIVHSSPSNARKSLVPSSRSAGSSSAGCRQPATMCGSVCSRVLLGCKTGMASVLRIYAGRSA